MPGRQFPRFVEPRPSVVVPSGGGPPGPPQNDSPPPPPQPRTPPFWAGEGNDGYGGWGGAGPRQDNYPDPNYTDGRDVGGAGWPGNNPKWNRAGMFPRQWPRPNGGTGNIPPVPVDPAITAYDAASGQNSLPAGAGNGIGNGVIMVPDQSGGSSGMSPIVLILILGGVGVAGYFIYKKFKGGAS